MMAAMAAPFVETPRRVSLPASLLEPLPNLEYWNYLDRPDLFAAYVLKPSVEMVFGS